MPRRELLKLNESLRRENQQLPLQAMQAEETARENARLRQLLGWQQQTSWKLKLARVVLRDPANWWRTVQIDLGSRDGLRVNLPVLTTDGLVGRISSVSLTRSQVVLLGDPNCKVAARVENETPRHRRSSAPPDRWKPNSSSWATCPGNANLKPGQNVVTSGEGGIFPQGIPIGKVVDVQTGGLRPAHRGAREAGGESERAGRGVGDVPMNWLQQRSYWARLSWRCFGRPRSAACAICSARRSICCRR